MPYISTDLNRNYAALESSYGATPAPTASNAFRALKTSIDLVQTYLERQDKTGSRSSGGVIAVPSATAINVDPPFSAAPPGGSSVTGTVTYPLGDTLPSLSLFDYWSPSTAQQRILCGTAVDQLEVDVSGDFHQIKFSGLGQ